MIPIGECVLTRLQKNKCLPWRTQITSRLRICSNMRKRNIEIAIFTIRYQSSYSRFPIWSTGTHKWQYRKWSKQTRSYISGQRRSTLTIPQLKLTPQKRRTKKKLYRRRSFDARNAIFNTSSEFISLSQAILMQSQNIVS